MSEYTTLTNQGLFEPLSASVCLDAHLLFSELNRRLIDTQNLSPELPEHIKAAIKALAQV